MLAMAAPIALRTDFNADALRREARRSRDAAQARRLLALASIYDGGSRSAAARIGGVTLQIVRDWVLRFNADGPAGLVDRKAPGKPPLLTPEQRIALSGVVEAGPTPYLDGVVRWRLVDLAQWLWERFGVSVSRQTLGRELRGMGYRKLSARPRHYGQDPDAQETFKKTSPSAWRRSAPACRPEPRSNSGGRMKPGSARRTS
jgi:transposase